MLNVTFVSFHTSQFIPGIGTIGNDLPSQSKTYKLDMKADGSWLYVDIEHNGKRADVAIPIASVKIVKYDKEEKKAKAA